jgi:hypothetical protein
VAGGDGPAIDGDWGEADLTLAERVYGWNSFAGVGDDMRGARGAGERDFGYSGVSETLCMEFSPCGFHGSSIEPFGI